MGIKKYPFGIDLGTTNSALAIYTGGTAETVTVQGGRTIPSVVWYKPDGSVIVGAEAYKRKGKPYVVYSSKRDMGTDTVYHLTLEDGSAKDVTPIEVASEVLKAIVAGADKMYGEVDEAVITVPAYFNDRQRAATRQAAELAGIKVLAMINEPTAAAFAYGVNKQVNTAESVIVVDVGGGTTDITYMTISNFKTVEDIPEKLRDVLTPGLTFDVIATGGNNRLGGDDYDEATIKSALARLLSENAQHRKSLKNIKDGTKAKQLAENTHIDKFLRKNFTVNKYKPIVEQWKQFEDMDSVSVSCTAEDQEQMHFSITHKDLEAGFSIFWAQIDKCIEDTMNYTTTDENGEEIKVGRYLNPSVCIPVGGSTKNPWLQQCLIDKFKDTGMEIPNASFADEAIALGAAVKAAIVKGVETDITLKEINPLPIGVETVGERNGKEVPGIFYPVILKDVTIPARAIVPYSTSVDNQTAIQVNIYQGVSNLVCNNQSLGTFTVDNLPPKKAGEVTIDLVLEVDIDGLLSVTAYYENREQTVKLNSVLNSATRTFTKAEERTQRYLLNVRDYMESIGETDTPDYAAVSNWIPGNPIPEYALKHKKEINAFVAKHINATITNKFSDTVETQESEDSDDEENE